MLESRERRIMPELPEVETIRRGLKDFILHKKITKIEVFCDKSFQGQPGQAENHAIKEIRRFGKALILDLDNDTSLMIHLRMTGQLIYDGARKERYAAGHPSDNFTAELPNKQTRVLIKFTDGTLYFNDQRKFGFIKIIRTTEVVSDPFIKKLAKEPWVMTIDEFYDKLQKHKNSCIKATILDQTIICGLGNIYADESLFAAGIHPERRSGSITREEAAKLLQAACDVMDKSIESGGSTMATYVKADGTKGDYLEKFAQVFHREGQPCPKCSTEIIKIRVAGRGTHLCPRCQERNHD
ncbi:bifunctional DNA-formamidopyrimidine glycosylase/DNA-(apurinic or apyrimidinic site) lyase [Candidatus Saccharibacteria bacterium]|nr:bifunctional DNA-formamidopyrimidine glycosylase/DNA-(apurinic or apyrimidinic site) lyase [Candidatus Saccharibacteria bacterium]